MMGTLSATIFITAFMFSGLGVSQSLLAQNDAATQKGNEIYQYWCATCHGAGPGHPGTTALAARVQGRARDSWRNARISRLRAFDSRCAAASRSCRSSGKPS